MVTTRRAAKANSSVDTIAMPTTKSSPATRRTSPFLPTSLERLFLAAFPVILLFGTIFSSISPQTRAAPYDPIAQSHVQDSGFSPSYFAKKSNIFNIVFVKRGWAWITLAFAAFLFTHPSTAASARRVRAGIRWAMVTTFWFLVTQWCFGPPIIDRGFRWTGGRCELAHREVEMGDSSIGDKVTAVACKAAGGKWKGGHDISGHVFLLTLGTTFLLQEIGWAVSRWAGRKVEERCVIMPDGALKSASVEAETLAGEGHGDESLGLGTKFALGVVALSVWMLLMTAIYFHTWFEKLTGLLTASAAIYVVYIVPRFSPSVRQIVGLPGI